MRAQSSTSSSSRDVQAVSTVAVRPRVLVLRSCRAPQFVAAVDEARRRNPSAEVVALAHRGHRDSLAAAGVDRVIEIGGRRFGVLRTNPVTLARLRRERFCEVVVPQMTPHPSGHGNLYRLAATLGAARVTIVPGGEAPRTFERAAFRRNLVRQIGHDAAAVLQHPAILFLLLIAARFTPRRRGRADGGRRRVLHVISSLGVGGAQRQLAELLNATAEAGDVEVLVLCREDGDFSRQWFARRSVPVTYVTAWPRLVSSVLEVRRHCRRGRYDVVHTWLFLANVIGAAGARLAGTPRVVASVRSMSLWKRTWYRQWWLRTADVLGARAADLVTVNAVALADDHARWALYPSRRIAVVHNGLDPSRFLVDRREARRRLRQAAGLAADAPVIGTVGRLAPEKDHLTFLRLVQRVREVRPDVHGVIVGDGQLRAALERETASMGLAGGVSFLGERDDARTLIAGLDVFALTSVIEGFPNALLEAAFLGVPAIGSRVGGTADVLANDEDAFAPGDAGAAAARVLTYLDDPSLAAAGAERTRQRAFTLFTADRAAARWCALYDHRSSKEALL